MLWKLSNKTRTFAKWSRKKKNEVTAMEEQTIPFEVLVHPNEEQLKKRDAFISSMEKNVTIVKMDSDGIIAGMVVE